MPIEQEGKEKLGLSSFRMYSYGVVAANKPLDSWDIEVTPIEDLNMLNGEVTDNIEQLEASSSSSTGAAYSGSVKATSSITAKWLPFPNPNRRTPPDVRRGAVVMIYQFADADYYWTCLKDDMELRRLETVIYAWSADPNKAPDPASQNCYYLEISTHTKNITFYTSKANGEPFAYTLQLNTGEGKFTFTDDIDNYIHMDSNRNFIELRNNNGCFFNLDGDDCNLNVVNDWNVTVGNNINRNVGSNENSDVGSSINQNAGSSISNSAGSGITNSAPAITEDAASIALNGTISSGGGSFGGKGDVKMAGDVKIEGVVSADQGADFGGTVKANKIISSEPISAPNV